MVDKSQARAIAAAAQTELARRCLIPFAKRLHPGFLAPPHIEYIATMLEAVERGDIRRLAISLQPGSGKSTLLQLFGGWYLGRGARRKIITTSAGAELAERNSRATRSLFTEDAWPFGVRLSSETTAQHRWDTSASGGLVAIGQGALITGWRADLIICDDLQNDAGTENDRASLWQWYREILGPRLEPGGAIVVVQTRWSEDDLLGRIIESDEGAAWTIVNLPAIAGEGDVLGRAPGEALWPQRFDLEELQKRRLSMGSRAFSCQFLGAPVPLEGNLVKAAWLQRYDTAPETFEKIVCALDSAAKVGVANDFSAIATLGVNGTGYFLLDVVRRKVEFPELLKLVTTTNEHHHPSAIYVEDTSNATALIQQLKRDSLLPIVPVKATGSKISRVEAITGLMESGRVFLPREAPWLLDFERELLAFPNAKHDDQVDAFTMTIAQTMDRPYAYAATFGFDADGRYSIDVTDEAGYRHTTYDREVQSLTEII